MSGSSDLHVAINSLWVSSDLKRVFNRIWSEDDAPDFTSLAESEATPDSPFPYCVYSIQAYAVISRMSATYKSKREIRDYPVDFHIHSRELEGDARSAKQIASDLMDELTKIFGGHPTVAPTRLPFTTGTKHLINQLQSDYGARTSDRTYEWVLNYLIRLDVPVMSTAN